MESAYAGKKRKYATPDPVEVEETGYFTRNQVNDQSFSSNLNHFVLFSDFGNSLSSIFGIFLGFVGSTIVLYLGTLTFYRSWSSILILR